MKTNEKLIEDKIDYIVMGLKSDLRMRALWLTQEDPNRNENALRKYQEAQDQLDILAMLFQLQAEIKENDKNNNKEIL